MKSFIFVLILLSSAASPAQNNPLDGVGFDQHIGRELPLDSVVTDEYGRTKKLEAYFGHRPVVFVFSYYKCPNLCTLVLNGVALAIKTFSAELGKNFDILTLSIDPDEKAPLALAKRRTYLARLGKTESDENTSWHFLTGTEDQLKQITGAAGFHYQRDQKSREFIHPSGILVVSPNGMISQYFLGIYFDPRKLRYAIGAAGSEIKGSVVDNILLYCFHYDPLFSRNGPRVILAVRLAAIAGMTVLVFLLGFLLYRSSRSEREA